MKARRNESRLYSQVVGWAGLAEACDKDDILPCFIYSMMHLSSENARLWNTAEPHRSTRNKKREECITEVFHITAGTKRGSRAFLF
jgi:hypothetical protein